MQSHLHRVKSGRQECPLACTALALENTIIVCTHAPTQVWDRRAALCSYFSPSTFTLFPGIKSSDLYARHCYCAEPPCDPRGKTCHGGLKLDCKILVIQLYKTVIQEQRGTSKAPWFWHEANSYLYICLWRNRYYLTKTPNGRKKGQRKEEIERKEKGRGGRVKDWEERWKREGEKNRFLKKLSKGQQDDCVGKGVAKTVSSIPGIHVEEGRTDFQKLSLDVRTCRCTAPHHIKTLVLILPMLHNFNYIFSVFFSCFLSQF